MHTLLVILAYAAFILALYGLTSAINYKFGEEALLVTWFGFPVRRVPYGNIESVRRGTALWNEHWNRASRDPYLTLRLRRGFARNFVINPPHTDSFISELRAHLTPHP